MSIGWKNIFQLNCIEIIFPSNIGSVAEHVISTLRAINQLKDVFKCILMAHFLETHISCARKSANSSYLVRVLCEENSPTDSYTNRMSSGMIQNVYVRCVHAKPFSQNFAPFNELLTNKGPFKLFVAALSKMCCRCHLESAAPLSFMAFSVRRILDLHGPH